MFRSYSFLRFQPASQPKKKKQKAAAPTSDQWEQWKQKDEQMVDGNFENELQQVRKYTKNLIKYNIFVSNTVIIAEKRQGLKNTIL